MQSINDTIDTEFAALPELIKQYAGIQGFDVDAVTLGTETKKVLDNTLKMLVAIKSQRTPAGISDEDCKQYIFEDAFLSGQISLLSAILETIPAKN